ncbi:MAG: bifunctional 2-polyprenyl-6-hydroxyphenol methylase/3-demethylubiquinol 3-O-methyltransferase UbiG [Alphaproteobacteria bacterium]
MENLNPKYYEPLEQMMSVRHQYMGKIISSEGSGNIYDFFKNQHILDLGCGTGKFLHNYYELGAICSGVDLVNNFQFQNKKNYKLINSNFQNFLKKNRKKFDVIFIFEFLEHLTLNERKFLFKYLPKILKTNGIIFLSTLNRNIVSTFMSINIAENLLKLLPKNTHDPKLYLKPSEIQTLSNKNSLKLLNVQGMSYNPLLKSFRFSEMDLINYFATITN